MLCGALLFFAGSTIAEAAPDDPSSYHVSQYIYALGAKIISGVPDIYHGDTVTILYGASYDMELVTSEGISDLRAELYFVSSEGRQFEYTMYDDYVGQPRYTWESGGMYEIDVYGVLSGSSSENYLTTMSFEVVMSGGPAPTCELTVTPETIFPAEGESAVMEWSTSNADQIVIDQGIGTVASTGSLGVAPNATTTYTLTATGAGGSVECQATLAVKVEQEPEPSCTLEATPSEIVLGESSSLTWSTENATSFSIDNGIGPQTTSDFFYVVSPTATTTYIGVVEGPGGTAQCQTTVGVTGITEQPLHVRAAELAKQVVNADYLGDGDTFGGKGWNMNEQRFVTAQEVFSGYDFWNNKLKKIDFGDGLDCSGLIMWSYNAANNPVLPNTKNVILMEGADGQYRNNVESASVVQSELQPGDLLFFSTDGTPESFKDHVAMYVGESGGFDIVEAASPQQGIIPSNLSERVLDDNFIGEFQRVSYANPPAVAFRVASPVDLVITDPDGTTISATTAIQTQEEYLTEVPGEWYYSEMVLGGDGRPADYVYSYTLREGEYKVQVIPDETAAANDTYSLTFQVGDEEVLVVQDESISLIPDNGFRLMVDESGIVGLDPAIKTNIDELYQMVDGFEIQSASRKKNLLATVESASSWFDRNRVDQIERKLGKVRGDIEKHVVDELTVEQLTQVYSQIDEVLVLLSI